MAVTAARPRRPFGHDPVADGDLAPFARRGDNGRERDLPPGLDVLAGRSQVDLRAVVVE